jgi:hypothetical protein
LNYTADRGRTYKDFICLHAGGNLDADLTFTLSVDRTRLDSGGDFTQPNFWTQGWVQGVDPQVILDKLNAANSKVHCETIMFGRDASCAQTDRYDDPAVLPGWQEIDGDSLLVNGRPLDGQLAIQPIVLDDTPRGRVTAIRGKGMSDGTPVRVTGALVLDCGHFAVTDPFDSCREDDADEPNHEIHPVYAIDVIDATARDNLTGVWADNRGLTYYVRHVGNLVWWFGMGPARDMTFAQVFRGTLGNGVIDGSWQDVPFGTGDSAAPLRLAVDPGKLRLTPMLAGPLSDRRWIKLYDAPIE